MLKLRNEKAGRLRALLTKPARLITLSFMSVIAVGTFLLALPAAARDGSSIGWMHAWFTSTSATCVTGLLVVDTATHWSLFGQVIILLLIQIGGLGMITITTFFFVMARRKIGFRTMVVAQESTASLRFSDVKRLVRRVMMMTGGIELVGAGVLATQYVPIFGWQQGLFKALFHSISAFCNAGFDLLGDGASGPFSSLAIWSGNALVLVTTALLIILGGLGFIVISSLLTCSKKKSLPFHSKLVLFMTGLLLVSGTVLFWLSEHHRSTVGVWGAQPAGQRLLAAFFQSTTARTAGFSSVDQAALTGRSKIGTMLLMFIGAAPGSTGGGIKVTTFAMLIAAVFAELRGFEHPILLRHRIARPVFNKAFLILALGLVVVLTTTWGIIAIEDLPLRCGTFSELDILFEAISAFATVGLSTLGTSALQAGSWILLIFSMIVGRVGPASFAISLMQEPRPGNRERVHPEGRCIVG